MKCPTEDQLLLLLDGGIAPNQADGMRAHVTSCAACKGTFAELETFVNDVAAPPPLDVDAHIGAVIDRIDREPADGAKPAGSLGKTGALLGAAFAAVAMAAGVMMFVKAGPGEPASGFAPRGSATTPTLTRDVGVRLFTGETDPTPLAEGTSIAKTAAFSATYTNLHPRSAYVLVFGVDAAGTVHWLYPAYTSAADDPPSMPLDHAERPRAFPTSVIVDAPAGGPMRIVSLATESPLHVSDIERRSPSALTLTALRQGFPGASVAEVRAEIVEDRP